MHGLRKWLVLLLAVLGIGIMAYSGYQMYTTIHERDVSKKTNQQITDRVVTTRPSPTEADRVDPDPAQETAETLPGETAPIDVDFPYLQEICGDVIAWIYSEDTKINYPVVLSADNADYLHRLIDGTTNAAGTLFMDCRNTGDFSDENSIIYGHHMKDGSMFAGIELYDSQAYYDAHPEMYILTPAGDYKLELFSGMLVSADDDTVYTTELTVEEAGKRMEASDFRSDVQLREGDRFVTLSTCAYSFNSARYVVTGVLRPLT